MPVYSSSILIRYGGEDVGKMNKNLLNSFMARFGDTQKTLDAMGISLSRLNAKINETGGAEFVQSEMDFIATRYQLSADDVVNIFFAQKVS